MPKFLDTPRWYANDGKETRAAGITGLCTVFIRWSSSGSDPNCWIMFPYLTENGNGADLFADNAYFNVSGGIMLRGYNSANHPLMAVGSVAGRNVYGVYANAINSIYYMRDSMGGDKVPDNASFLINTSQV